VIAIPAKYDFMPIAFGFQKDFPYLDLFNYMLKELKEKGIYDKIAASYEP
jgi:ABC-type amino acid transport substrate-binding protein